MDLKPFKFPILVLKTVGVWQDGTANFLYKLYGLILHLYFIEQGAVLSTMIVIVLIQEGNMIEFTQALSTSLSVYVTLIKSIVFVININRIKNLMASLKELLAFSDFTKSNNRPLVLKYEARIMKITKYNYNFHFVICTLSVIMAVMSSDRRLPFKTYSYFDYENDDNAYMFMNCAIYFMSLYVTGINGMLDIYPVIFMCYIIAMIEELDGFLSVVEYREKLRKNLLFSSYSRIIDEISIYGGKLPKIQSKRFHSAVDLASCVKFHVRIKEFCEDVSKNYALHFMAQGFLSSLILCSTIFHLTKITFKDDAGLFMTTLMYATIMVAQILLPCYFGNKIYTKSNEISMSLFHSNWIYGDKMYAKNVKLIMENLKLPMRIRVYGFFSVDYEIFKSVCNLAYSMYAVLNKKQA